MYFVICKNDQGQYEYATPDAFNRYGAQTYANTIDADRCPMVIEEVYQTKTATDERAVKGSKWLDIVRCLILYGNVGMTKPGTRRGPEQLKAT